ncbi:hypothetical protein K2X05_14060 [bacterium]|nr:hypothetical protein [bacterium]
MKEVIFLQRINEAEQYFQNIRRSFPDNHHFPEYVLGGIRKEILENYPLELKQKGFSVLEGSFLALAFLNSNKSFCRDAVHEYAQFWATSFMEVFTIEGNLEESISSGVLSEYFDRSSIKSDKKAEVLKLFIK